MADILPTWKTLVSGVKQVSWLNVTENDNCLAVFTQGLPDRSVQVTGSFNTVTIDIQGSEDGVNYVTLDDNGGNPLVFTTLVAPTPIAAACAYTKPSISGGSGTSVNIYITCTTSGN